VVWMKFCLWTIKRPNPLHTAAYSVCDVIFLHWNAHTQKQLDCTVSGISNIYGIQCCHSTLRTGFNTYHICSRWVREGLNSLTLQLHFTQKKQLLQSSSRNKHQLYKKGYIYFFAQLMFMYIWWSFVNTPKETCWIIGALSNSCVCC
jgi:hypothetical protein